jgi:hypothetical protein
MDPRLKDVEENDNRKGAKKGNWCASFCFLYSFCILFSPSPRPINIKHIIALPCMLILYNVYLYHVFSVIHAIRSSIAVTRNVSTAQGSDKSTLPRSSRRRLAGLSRGVQQSQVWVEGQKCRPWDYSCRNRSQGSWDWPLRAFHHGG